MKKFVLVSLFLESEGISHKIITGVEALKLSQGKVDPSDGLVKLVLCPEVISHDIYQAVEFVNKHGLKRC
jgi:hypothetical protein